MSLALAVIALLAAIMTIAYRITPALSIQIEAELSDRRHKAREEYLANG